MSSAGAAAGARAARKILKANYNQAMFEFVNYLQTEKKVSIKNQFHLIKYSNPLYIPKRFLLIESQKNFFVWQYRGKFKPEKNAEEIIEINKQNINLETKKPSIFDKLNIFWAKEFLVLKSDVAPKIFDGKKFVVEDTNVDTFDFWDKDRQEQLKAIFV